MLYFLHGTDTKKTFAKAQALVGAMIAKKPNASLFKLTTEHFTLAELQELVGGQGLFEQKYIVNMSRLIEDATIGEQVMAMLDDIATSDNIFIWIEESVTKPLLKKIEKVAEKIEHHDLKETSREQEVNAFPLTDALGARNKKKAWLLYIDLIEKIPVEEIHGVLMWMVKSMVLAHKTKSATDAGLKPFVYSKAKKFAGNFSGAELDTMSERLMTIYHDARRGKGDLALGVETFLLKL